MLRKLFKGAVLMVAGAFAWDYIACKAGVYMIQNRNQVIFENDDMVVVSKQSPDYKGKYHDAMVMMKDKTESTSSEGETTTEES